MAGANAVLCQDYPNKPIRIITSAPGGGTDFTSRQIAQGISGVLGQPIIVDNRSGIPAAEAVAKAPPDGYTLNVAGSTLWILPLLYKMPYDATKDFAPVSMLVREIYILVVHPSLPIKSVKELISLAKAKPGVLNYSSGSIGGSGHLAVELFASMAGIKVVHVPYKGTAPAVSALIGGEAQFLLNDAGTLMPHVKSGKLRVLAVASAQPSALTPGLPTVAASGVPGYEWVGMSVLLAPAKTPVAIVNRLHQEISRAFNTTEVKERFFNAGQEVVCSTPEELSALMKSDMARLSKVIKEAGIKVD
jgi:tripartite-type tricarboxylate transporter receptor subunit TctC